MISSTPRRFALFLAVAGLLAACGRPGAPATQSPPVGGTAGSPPTGRPVTAVPPAARATASGTVQPATLAAAPTAAAQPTPAAAAGAIPEGLTPEGYHFLGRADAPATLEMYSDFL
jgi:hypothetical protein